MTARKMRELVKRERPRPAFPLRDIEHWFEEAWKKPFSLFEKTFWPELRYAEPFEISPNVDIYEEEKEVVIKADLPGMKKQDIKVDLTENVMTISGEKSRTEKIEKEEYYRYERSFGSFCRRFELPAGIETDKVKAHFEDGVLEVRIPKTRQAEHKHKKISID